MSELKTGDKGQRYQVQCKKPDGSIQVVGWTDDQKSADNMAYGITLHPSFHSPKIIDRKKRTDDEHI